MQTLQVQTYTQWFLPSWEQVIAPFKIAKKTKTNSIQRAFSLPWITEIQLIKALNNLAISLNSDIYLLPKTEAINICNVIEADVQKYIRMWTDDLEKENISDLYEYDFWVQSHNLFNNTLKLYQSIKTIAERNDVDEESDDYKNFLVRLINNAVTETKSPTPSFENPDDLLNHLYAI